MATPPAASSSVPRPSSSPPGRCARPPSSSVPGSSIRRSGAIYESTPCRWSPAGSRSVSRCGAGRCRGRARSSSPNPRPGRNGYVLEAAPGHPGLMALALPWEGAEAHARVMAASAYLSPFIAVTRDGGEGRATLTRAGRVRLDYQLDAVGFRNAAPRLRLDGAPRPSRRRRPRSSRSGTPPTWYHPSRSGPDADAARLRSVRGGTRRVRLSRQTVPLSSRPTRWARSGWARIRDPPVRSVGSRPRRGQRRRRRRWPLRRRRIGFPTGIGANPMITIMALARRVSRAILADT